MKLAFYCLVQKYREGNKHKLKNSVQNTKSYFSQQLYIGVLWMSYSLIECLILFLASL